MENKDKETAQKIWNFDNIPIKIISSTLKSESHGTFVYTSGAGETYALLHLNSFLGSLYPSLDISFHLSVEFETAENYKQNHLILIGGPGKNKVTDKILRKFSERQTKLRWNFNEKSQILNREKSKKYEYEEFDNRFIDYGIILKDHNPFDRNKLVFIVAGCRSMGTVAGMHLLTNSEVMKAIIQKYPNKLFVILIKIDSRDLDSPDDPVITAVDCKELEAIKVPIILPPLLNQRPTINIRNIPDIPIKKYLLWSYLGITGFSSSLVFIFSTTLLVLPGLLASMALLFALPLQTWKKHKVIIVNPAFALFGFLASLGWCITSIIGIIIKILVK